MNYLIPANTKRGQLILGLFRPFDLALVSIGVLITIVLLAFMPLSSTFVTILILSPGVISALLVMPVPNYHNILNILVELYQYFFVNEQKYIWRGWCYKEWLKK